MGLHDTLMLLSRGMAIIVGVIVIAALHLGQDIFVPLALAGMLCFLLTPLVNRLERWRIPRVPAVLATTALAFAVIGAIGYVVAGQLIDLAYKLPSYQQNISAKITSFQVPSEGPWKNITKTFTDLQQEMETGGTSGEKAASALGNPGKAKAPMPVEVVNSQSGFAELAQRLATPVLGPVGTGAVVIVFVIFMLLKKEDLRNRVIHLAGRSRLSLTTRALEEAGTRVSRYLLMQLIVNVSYGIPIAAGLALIGVPNALLWGVLTAVLRFIPYLGPWIGAFFPLALSLAVSQSWAMPIYTLALFLVVELLSNNVVEPWLYGSSTGLSAVAILVAAIFWTWLWGTVGLLLATPLTVCLAVLGKHVPALGFLDILLGDEPSLPAADRYYQRLLAKDEVEAEKVVVEYEKLHSFERVLTDIMAPAIMAAESDLKVRSLDPAGHEFILKTVRKQAVRVNSSSPQASPDNAPPDVLIIAAEDEGDEVVGVILGELLGPKIRTQVVSWKVLASEKTDLALNSGAPVLCISDTSRDDAPRARFLGRKLRARSCPAFVVTGLWALDDEESNLAALAEKFSADQAATNLLVARDALRGWVVQTATTLAPVEPETIPG